LIRLTDDLGRTLTLPSPPSRVISLVPSDTYSIYRLGAAARLVGRTDYCVEPPELAEKIPSVGGTKNPRVEEILSLRPELVIANQEENTRGDIEALDRAGIPTLVDFPKTVAAGIEHLARMARALGVEEAAAELLSRGRTMLEEAEGSRAKARPLRVFCPIWMDPLMTIHGDTFISDMLDLAGGQNVFCDRPRRYPLAADLGRAAPLPPERVEGRDTRYPRVTKEEVVARGPEVVLLPDEPHPFSEEDAEVFRRLDIPAARSGAILLCAGKDLCWPGAQSIEGFYRLRELLNQLRERLQQGS
jgi:ABC-type Fe3+-hydroxamate transport system substrate-binding protein